MTDTLHPNGMITSDHPCPQVDCVETDKRHWHQHYDDHSPWRFGGGCPTHLHRYEQTQPTKKEDPQ